MHIGTKYNKLKKQYPTIKLEMGTGDGYYGKS